MAQAKYANVDTASFEKKWVIQEAILLEREKEELKAAKKELEEQKSLLDRKIRDFEARKILDEKNRQHERLLFETKFHVLETELKKLAAEKEKIEKEKAFYKAVNNYQSSNIVEGKIFFKGITNAYALKKRYKDLIKIYHPDNENGDNYVLQEINDEYNELKVSFDL